MKSLGRVAVLMSGGVDSSVSAALLKEQGFDVIGFYILGWLGTPEFPCPWQKEEKDARAVAGVLDIPFYTVNLSKVYEKEVIDRFFTGYQAGLTPNPDILCNREIKFKALWQAIRQFECDKLATGHYAKLQQVSRRKSKVLIKSQVPNSKSIKTSKIDNYFRLQPLDLEPSYPAIFKPADKEKDQTYFLWGIDRAMLDKIIFPLGELTKPEVRELAKKYKLPTASKKDSQGICFIGPLKVRQFLASKVETKAGNVYLADGRKIATHRGVELYTIGERLAAGSVDWTGDVPPLYVIAKDILNNRLIVGSDSETFGDNLIAGSLNWLIESPGSAKNEKLKTDNWKLKTGFEGLAKIRYRQEDVSVTVRKISNQAEVAFGQPVRALTAGQSIVFYSTDGLPRAKSRGQLLGGGIIELIPQQDATVKRLTQNLG